MRAQRAGSPAQEGSLPGGISRDRRSRKPGSRDAAPRDARSSERPRFRTPALRRLLRTVRTNPGGQEALFIGASGSLRSHWTAGNSTFCTPGSVASRRATCATSPIHLHATRIPARPMRAPASREPRSRGLPAWRDWSQPALSRTRIAERPNAGTPASERPALRASLDGIATNPGGQEALFIGASGSLRSHWTAGNFTFRGRPVPWCGAEGSLLVGSVGMAPFLVHT
jgi:hypothetical protein